MAVETTEKRRGKPTLRTISELTGLAVPTVSRALNDAPDIGQTTKERVRKVAREIGYVPNRAGVRLRTGRTNVISLVLSTEHDMMNHTGRLMSSLAGQLQGTPFHLNVTPYFPDDDLLKPIRYIVETRSADAVILNQIQPQDPRIAYLMGHNFPFAAHGRTIWCDRHPYFDFDNTKFGALGIRKLAAKGRKNILAIAPPQSQNYALDMIEGVRTAAQDLGINATIAENVTSDSPRPDLLAEVPRYLAANPTCDGIICASTSATFASVASVESVGRVLGRDMDVFAKEAVPILTLFRSEIMSVAEDVAEAGQFLAKAAMQAIKSPDLPPMQRVVEPDPT